jgi:predicted nucleic acid-binding protein
VSALWSADGAPAEVVSLAISGVVTPCLDLRIMEEYRGVLARPKFGFSENEISDLLDGIDQNSLSVVATPKTIELPDSSNRKFLEVADSLEAVLVTGNKRHFPQSDSIVSPSEFLDLVARQKGG